MGNTELSSLTRTGDPVKRMKEFAAQAQSQMSAKSAQGQDQAEISQQLFLPGITELLRAMPNQVARSSLFAPVARGRRKFHRETIMITRADVTMSYVGEQLDEADADLMLQLIHLALPHLLGVPVPLNRAALLKAIGRDTGKQNYKWLHRRIKAMTVSTLFIEARKPDGSVKYRIGYSEGFHIIQSFGYDDALETYTFAFDPRWRVLFSNREFALIDWEKRLQIQRGQDLAKALQRLVATSADYVQRYELIWLKDKMQHGGRLRDFKSALNRAVEELVRLEIINTGRIEKSGRGKEQLALWALLAI